jgi:pilus assembly protein FimV
MPNRCALVLALSLAFAAPMAHSASLGRINVLSALGQPLRAEVEVTAVSREEAASLAVRLAPAAAFRQANLDMNPALSGLRVTLDRRGDSGYVVRLTSPAAVNEPYLDLLLELTSASGRVLREYTILLDPPALRAAQDVVAPAAGRAPSPAAAVPVPAPAATAPRPAAPAVAPARPAATVSVKRGDTLGGIAERTRPASASLDQMLVALFRANPDAFIGSNMNILRAGSVLTVPQEPQVLATDAASARREVVAQSADFERYRSRLAQAATESAPGAAAATGRGQITTRVEDGKKAAPSGDQLKIAQAAPEAKTGDESVARDRQIKDLLDRVAELERTNQELQKALELQSKSGAQVQAAAEGKPAPAQPAAPAATPPAAQATPAPAAAQPPAAAPAPSPAPKVAAPPAPAPAAAPDEAPGMLANLVSSNLPLVATLGTLLLGLVGYGVYRRRRSARTYEDYDVSAEAARGNSLFGQTGGQSVDTGDVSAFNASFIPPATQVDSTEVDPVAEADVYIAYGREEQAEDILKEALRHQPDRHAARLKLMEILARRGDKAGFSRHAQELMTKTGSYGEDWERAADMGRALDPANPLFSASAAITVPLVDEDAMTELKLGGPTTPGGPHSETRTTRGRASVPSAGEGMAGATAQPAVARPSPDSVHGMETQITGDTLLPLDSRANAGAGTTKQDTRPLREGEPTDLSELEFEALNAMPATQIVEPAAAPVPAAAGAPLEYDLNLPPAAQAPRDLPNLPDLDLNLPPVAAPRKPSGPKAPVQAEAAGALDFDLHGTPAATRPGFGRVASSPAPAPAAPLRPARPLSVEEQGGQSTLLGGMTALPEGMTRLSPNTDQATVPLIDFDLSGAELPLNTAPGRTVAMTGSPMASQIATKLDLARGYIDLGVRDGARELLEEVMRDGTREQRQAAIDLMKQVDR